MSVIVYFTFIFVEKNPNNVRLQFSVSVSVLED